jgi:hypothetical protein
LYPSARDSFKNKVGPTSTTIVHAKKKQEVGSRGSMRSDRWKSQLEVRLRPCGEQVADSQRVLTEPMGTAPKTVRTGPDRSGSGRFPTGPNSKFEFELNK